MKWWQLLMVAVAFAVVLGAVIGLFLSDPQSMKMWVVGVSVFVGTMAAVVVTGGVIVLVIRAQQPAPQPRQERTPEAPPYMEGQYRLAPEPEPDFFEDGRASAGGNYLAAPMAYQVQQDVMGQDW